MGMIRDEIQKYKDHDPHFSWRGDQVTRIENLSDIVFALALSMLVFSSSDVTNFNQLTRHLTNIIPVTAGFAILLGIWNAHFMFFRRYGLADGKILFLNACLLLGVLFLAYPLRFIFESLFGYIMFVAGNSERVETMGIDYETAGTLMVYFSIGYAAVYLLINFMYMHAYSCADSLGLSDTEKILTRGSIWVFRAQIITAIVVCLCAAFTPLYAFAGMLMILLWPIEHFIRKKFDPDKAAKSKSGE